MIKTILLTFLVAAANVAEAHSPHSPCYTQDVWQPGYWQHTNRGSIWISGFYRQETHCPPPPPRQPVISVRVPPIFPHVSVHRHSYVRPPRRHNHTHHRSHNHRR